MDENFDACFVDAASAELPARVEVSGRIGMEKEREKMRENESGEGRDTPWTCASVE